jgi:hypothetical protein
MYNQKGTILRSAAETAIREGGSVLIGGRLYNRVELLPSEADFARGDEAAENAARENILRQRQALDDQLARLGQGGGNVATANASPAGAQTATTTRRRAASTASTGTTGGDGSGDASDQGDGLERLSVAELKDRAKAAGVPNADGMKKADLVDALRAAPPANTAPADQQQQG